MTEVNPNWYRLADGTQADPSDCSANDKGVLTHKNGVPVVVDSDGKPVEIAREPEENKTALAAKLGKDAESANAARVEAGLKAIAPAPAAKPEIR